MKRTAGAITLLAALGGCVTTGGGGPSVGGGCGSCGQVSGPASVPGVQGPWGQPVAMAAPYSASPPGAEAARAMMAYSMPMDLVQQAGAFMSPGSGSGIIQAGGETPGGPYQPMGPGMGGLPPPGAVAGIGAQTSPMASHAQAQRTEVAFAGPHGMRVSWYTPAGFAGAIVAPARYNFLQGALYRLKLSNLPNRPGVELYPTLEVVPANAKTDAFLAHSAVPITFTNEDLDQVAAGNFLVKVIYLPDPAFQDLAAAGPDEIVSARLEPGVDRIAEAARRGSILLVVRVGNINLELPNTPAMNSPSMYGPQGMSPMMPGHAMMPGMPANGMSGRSTPYGPVVQPMLLPAPSGTPPGATMGPVSKRSDLPATQQAQYKSTSSQTRAQLAGQTTNTTFTTDDPPAEKKAKKSWWWRGSDSN